MHIRLRKLAGRQRGDTIVEVMFVVAVIGAILAASFLTAQHSAAMTQTAQEHSEALKLAESQFELIKGVVDNNGGTDNSATSNNVFSYGGNPSTIDFCMYASDDTIYPDNDSTGHCSVDRNGQINTNSLNYSISVHRTDPTGSLVPQSDAYIFTVTVKWDDVSGNGQNNVQMVYRLYQSENVTITRPTQPGKNQGSGGRVGCQKSATKSCSGSPVLTYKRTFWVTSLIAQTGNVVTCTWDAPGAIKNSHVVWSANNGGCDPHKQTITIVWPTVPVCTKVKIYLTFQMNSGPDVQANPYPINSYVPYGQGANLLPPKGQCKVGGG